MSLRIGIDVGGTHTDAVILGEKNEFIAAVKTATTPDVTSGILNALRRVVEQSGIDPDDVRAIMLGTTHCTNAIIQRKDLAKVLVIRIGLPATKSIEPLLDWPTDLKEMVRYAACLVQGGHEYTGEEIAPLDEQSLKRIAREAKGKIESVAVTSVFSPVNPDHEDRAMEILREELSPTIPITLSHEIGSIGLLERENSAVLNAAVVKVASTAIRAFEESAREIGVEKAKLYITQNDGTLMEAEFAKRYPIFMIASGPSNSIRGAAFLTGLTDGIVVDVGGTSTDIGVLVKGFPRESAVAVEIGGVRTNFRMPDLISIGLGGGSIVKVSDEGVEVGPESVGYELIKKGIAWGGDTLTATDAVLAAGMATIEDPACDISRVKHLDPGLVSRILKRILQKVEDNLDKIKTSPEPVPVVLVGGGSILLPHKIAGASEVIRPFNFQYANAIGAAIAQVSGMVDKVYSLERIRRNEAIEDAKSVAMERAKEAGADPTSLEIVELEEIPLPYLPGNAVRIRVKAIGRLA